jgi:glycyl-tRNA synthetase alpha chain
VKAEGKQTRTARSESKASTSPKSRGLTFQDLLLTLEHYWTDRDCILQQPYDVEVGAGTMHPETFLRVLGPEPYRVVYAQPSRRPADGRYGENPNRLYKHTQLQVILKPSPADIQSLYLNSLTAVGINLKEHDVRFEEDNWESPTLGAWGIGWQVLLDGLEITQFTYFQQCGGIDLDPISVEITYGLDRIAAYLQGVDNVFDVRWSNTVTYRQVRLAEEQQFSAYSFDYADVKKLWEHLGLFESECLELLERAKGFEKMDALTLKRFPVLGAYELALKCSHVFNLLDARGAISVTERVGVMARIRALVIGVAKAYALQGELLAQGQKELVAG